MLHIRMFCGMSAVTLQSRARADWELCRVATQSLHRFSTELHYTIMDKTLLFLREITPLVKRLTLIISLIPR